MDISLENQDPMMDPPDQEANDMDSQQEIEDFEENPYNYGEMENAAEDQSMAEQTMKDMVYYNVL